MVGCKEEGGSSHPELFLQCQRAGVNPAAPAPPLPQPWGWKSNIICKEKLLVPRVQGLELMLECQENSVLMIEITKPSPQAHFQDSQSSPFVNIGFLGSLQMFICMTIDGLGTKTCVCGEGHRQAAEEAGPARGACAVPV